MSVNRRSFLKASGLSLLPAILPAAPILANDISEKTIAANEPIVKLFGDGEFYDGLAYLEQLQAANSKQKIKVDRYGSGGAVEELEKKFEGERVLPRPRQWGGFQVEPFLVEFWQGGPGRLHDRIQFVKVDNVWKVLRLAP